MIFPRLFKVKLLFRAGAFGWMDISYVIDWIVISVIWILCWAADYIPIYIRSFDLNDPLISHPQKENTIDDTLNSNIAWFLPLACFIIAGCVRSSPMEIHHGAIALCSARGMARLITSLLKHAIGRLRPDFLARCEWDESIKECTGDYKTILSGRRSFPSGHSSTAFSGMTVLAFWLAGMTAAWCFNVTTPPKSLSSSKLGRYILTLLPLSWATYVAISRVQDYRHHKEDVVVGSLIGILSAAICYLIYWQNPFSTETFADGCPSVPRYLYTDSDEGRRPDTAAFHLTQADEEGIENV